MEPTLQTTTQNSHYESPSGSDKNGQAALATRGFAAESFALSVRKWARERSSFAPKEAELISFQSAMKIVESTDLNEDHIDIPIVPQLVVFGLNKDLEKFSTSILGSENIKRPIVACSRLLSKILGEEGLEFKVDESRITNTKVLNLLYNLSTALPEFNIDLKGKWSINSKLDSPEYFLRISLKDNKLTLHTAITNDDNVPVGEQSTTVKTAERVRYKLPVDATPSLQAAENVALDGSKKLLELVRARHLQIQRGELIPSGILVSAEESPLLIQRSDHKFEKTPNPYLKLPLVDRTSKILGLTALASIISSSSLNVNIFWPIGICSVALGLVVKKVMNTIKLKNLVFNPEPTRAYTPCIRNLALDIIELGYKPIFVKLGTRHGLNMQGDYEGYTHLEVRRC